MIGKTLAHYQILEKIGQGGMGEVYRALDTKLDRDVAIKILPPDSARDLACRQRFEREAKAVAALKHPNIVTIYSVEETEGAHFITMELVEGQNLSDILPAGGLSLDQFFEIAIPLADAVSCAHARGITHRDLKPANIMVNVEQRLKVLDFGLAKLCLPHTKDTEQTQSTQTQLTKVGSVLGTVAYMSPEQISGGDVDHRSDVFSLGIIFHELLSGSRPFDGNHPAAIMYSIVNSDAPRLVSLPDVVAQIIDCCLKKAPGDRYSDAGELRSALQDLIGTPGTVPKTKPDVTPPEVRTAFAQADWKGAYGELRRIRERRELLPEELEVLAECALWLNEFDERLLARERAYATYAKSGRNIDAARVALCLIHDYIEKSTDTVAGGWQKRAERLLRNQGDCIEQGHLLRRQTVVALEECDFARALELNEKCTAVADRFNDSDLQAEALHDRGQILIALGDVAEGTGLVDEAMTSAISGEVSPTTLGNLYCRTMSVCRSLADFNRAREWSETAWRWCAPYGASPYQGICRVYSAETMRHQGRWVEAKQAARRACDDFTRHGNDNHAGEALNELGELALCEGDFQEAEDAFRRAHEFGYDPVPGLPLLRLAQGKGEIAQQIMERALSETPEDRLRRAKLLTATISIALANDNLSFAKAAVEELTDVSEDFGCPTFKAHAVMGKGAIASARGDSDVATPALREAWSIFNNMGFLYDAARARALMATAYLRAGNVEDARLQLSAACKTFSELGARPDLEVASELIKRLE